MEKPDETEDGNNQTRPAVQDDSQGNFVDHLDHSTEEAIISASDFTFKRHDAVSQTPDTTAPTSSSTADGVKRLTGPKSALTITFQSWATPVIGLVMLVVGLLSGYFIRPLLSPGSSENARPQTSSPNPTQDTQTQGSPEDREALMAALLPGVRHFLGSPDAPITMIEFSDFQ